MSNRIVVCHRFRGRPGGEAFAKAAAAIVRRAEALGGRVVAWHAAGVSVDFSVDALEDVVELVTEEGARGRRSAVPAELSAGVAEGSLTEVVDLGGRAALVHGEALERAEALAHVARPREVLVDPELGAVREERWLTRGSRLGVMGKARVRGLRLDTQRPWRADVAISVDKLSTPERVGPPPALEIMAGALSLIVGARGAGGSRALTDTLPPGSLVLRPVLGEPLGALSAALGARPVPSAFDAEHALSIESLVMGEGLDTESSASAVWAWLEASAGPRVVAIDDVEHVDADSLEVVAELGRRGAAVVVRTLGQLPSSLGGLPVTSQVTLEPFAGALGAELTRAFVSGALSDRVAARWVRRAGGRPLAIAEALAEAIESGELVVENDGSIGPRVRLAGRGPARAPEHWIERRLRFLDAPARRILAATAISGGSLALDQIEATLGERAPAGRIERALDDLLQRRLALLSGDVLELPSATHRASASEHLPEGERAQLHLARARALSRATRPMAAVAAAVHALLAGDLDGALPLARRGAAACQAAGMTTTAESLVRFTETGDPGVLEERGLLGGASTDRAGLQRSDMPPPPSLQRPEAASARGRQRDVELRPAPLSEPTRASDPLLGQVDEPELSARLARALAAGESAELDEIVRTIRADGTQALLGDRIEVMVKLSRGQIGEALRMSRETKEQALTLGPAEHSRASLAYAIALAAAGRRSDALLEALDGLARAREALDAQGERACARFVAKLSRGAGSQLAARAWSELAAG